MIKVDLRECRPLRAKITEKQCGINRQREVLACATCPGLGEVTRIEEPVAAGDLVLRFSGEDAEILNRFAVLAENGHTLAENVTTAIEMIIDGRMILRG